MTQVLIAACLSSDEQQALSATLDFLRSGLEPEKATVSLSLAADLDALVQAPAGTVRLMSLQTQLANLQTPWPEVEEALSRQFAALAETGDPVLIATVFRVVDRQLDDGHARLIRIRRLNLLATELSREFGAFVIDIDRVFADIGGQALKTDYRLQGQGGAELAGHTLAVGIATNALDAFIPFEAQERVIAFINSRQPADRSIVDLAPPDLMSMGKGRRRQRVSTVTDAVQENHVGWQLRQFMSGKIGFADAVDKLIMAVRRRGVKESFSLLTSGISKLINKKAHI